MAGRCWRRNAGRKKGINECPADKRTDSENELVGVLSLEARDPKVVAIEAEQREQADLLHVEVVEAEDPTGPPPLLGLRAIQKRAMA